MAKEKSLIKMQGTFQGVTFVESKAYGRHVRAARGSNKPALLNEEMEKSKANLIQVNPYGQMIKNALEPYRENFMDGTLWSRLLSFFRLKEAVYLTCWLLKVLRLIKAIP